MPNAVSLEFPYIIRPFCPQHTAMNLTATTLLALSMSADAFAASLARGAGGGKTSLSQTVKTALTFGVVETATPLIGWAAGIVAAPYIEAFDHWVAFVLLAALGAKMIREGLSPTEEERQPEMSAAASRWLLLLTAVATSIDSMIVGVTLAFLDADIWLTALTIGTATTLMSAIGLRLGSVLGSIAGKRAEICGGIVLIGIGTFILLEHLGYLR